MMPVSIGLAILKFFGLSDRIAKKFAPLALAALVLLLIGLAAWGLVTWLNAREEADDKANQEIGATIQREGNLRATIQNVETANEAAETVARNPGAARAECLRNARNTADC